MTINKKILYGFICVGLIILIIVFGYLRSGGVAPAASAPEPLTEQDKADVLKSLETSTSTTSGSPAALSDTEKRAVLDSLSGSTTRDSATASSTGPTPLSDEEKAAILKSLEKR